MKSSRGSTFWTRMVNTTVFLIVLTGLGTLLVAAPDAAEDSGAEQRSLAPMPDLSVTPVLDGSYSKGVDAWVEDHFPFRDQFLTAGFWLRAHRGLQSDTFSYYDMEVQEGGGCPAAEGGIRPDDEERAEALGAGEPLADPELDEAPAGGAPDEEDAEPAWDPEAPVAPALHADAGSGTTAARPPAGKAKDDGRLTSSKGIMIYRGRAMTGFGGSPNGSRGWAESVNAYQAELEGKVTIYGMIVPNASAFYLPEEYQRHTRSQKANIDATYRLLKPGIRGVDAFSEMARHADEDIFFRTDHHWTGRGAYYAYRAFCHAAGIEPVNLDQMETRTQKSWYGSLYGMTRDSRLVPDVVEYFIPPVSATVEMYPNGGLGKPRPWRLFFEGPTGYGVFLGGDRPMMAARTGLKNGRRVILTKNSYGNAIAPLLVSHFEEVIIIDYRYFTGSLLDVIKEHKVTDVIVLNGVQTANTGYHIWRVKQILLGRPLKVPAAPVAPVVPAAPIAPVVPVVPVAPVAPVAPAASPVPVVPAPGKTTGP